MSLFALFGLKNITLKHNFTQFKFDSVLHSNVYIKTVEKHTLTLSSRQTANSNYKLKICAAFCNAVCTSYAKN